MADEGTRARSTFNSTAGARESEFKKVLEQELSRIQEKLLKSHLSALSSACKGDLYRGISTGSRTAATVVSLDDGLLVRDSPSASPRSRRRGPALPPGSCEPPVPSSGSAMPGREFQASLDGMPDELEENRSGEDSPSKPTQQLSGATLTTMQTIKSCIIDLSYDDEGRSENRDSFRMYEGLEKYASAPPMPERTDCVACWERFVQNLLCPITGCARTPSQNMSQYMQPFAVWGDTTQRRRGGPDFWSQIIQMKRLREARNRQTCDSAWVNDDVGKENKDENSYCQKCVMKPHSSARLFLILLGMLFILYDLLFFPVRQVFSFSAGWVAKMDMLSVCYWTFDIPTQMMTGFMVGGMVELRLMPIFVNYMKTWMLPDLTMVGVEWSFLILELMSQDGNASVGESASIIRLTKVQRTARMLRLLRFVRILKMKGVLSEIIDSCQSEVASAFVKVLGHLLTIMMINHYIACFWVGLGKSTTSEVTWLQSHVMEGRDTDTYQYLAALHWSLTQFTPATNDISPQNGKERIFASCVVLFALIAFSSFVSSITGQMQMLYNLNSDRNKEEQRMREFFSRSNVSLKLQRCMWSYFRQHYAAKKKDTHEADVHFFREVPESMLKAMHSELYIPLIRQHPAFDEGIKFDVNGMEDVCHKACAVRNFKKGQDVFIEGTAAGGMFLVQKGKLSYSSPVHKASLHIEASDQLWISELALWTRWAHRGHLVAKEQTDLLEIMSDCFQDLVQRMDFSLKAYFTRYVGLVLQYCSRRRLPMTDVADGQDDVEKIVDLAAAANGGYRRGESFSSESIDADGSASMFNNQLRGSVRRISSF